MTAAQRTYHSLHKHLSIHSRFGGTDRAIQRLAKYAIDYIVAAAALVLSAPLLMICALAIKCDSEGPVIFCQKRVGWNSGLFTIYKLRTMVVGADLGRPDIEREDPRITRVGRFLRKTSLDELPQLLNVLKGEMSLIGPRPWLPGTLKPEESVRQSVKPGLASYQDLFGRQTLDWDRRIQLDLWYVRNWNLLLDLKIALLVVPVVLNCRSVYDDAGGARSRFPSKVDKKENVIL